MKKWKVKPSEWNNLTNRQQQQMYASGVRLAGKLMIGLVFTSLIIEKLVGQ
jgi:hypothetical protein